MHCVLSTRSSSAPILAWMLYLGHAGCAHLPPPPIPAPPPAETARTAPLTQNSDGALFCPVSLGGTESPWLVDTGFFTCVLNRAEDVHTAEVSKSPESWQVSATDRHAKSLPMAHISAKILAADRPFTSTAVLAPKDAVGQGIPDFNILGIDALIQTGAWIDFGKQTLRFPSSTENSKNITPAPEVYTRIPLLRGTDGILLVRGSVGGKPIRFLLDTGAVTSVGGSALFDGNSSQGEAVPLTLYSGSITGHRQRTEPVSVGDQVLQEEVIRVDDFEHAVVFARQEKIIGILGADILARKQAIIDVAGGFLYLRKSSP